MEICFGTKWDRGVKLKQDNPHANGLYDICQHSHLKVRIKGVQWWRAAQIFSRLLKLCDRLRMALFGHNINPLDHRNPQNNFSNRVAKSTSRFTIKLSLHHMHRQVLKQIGAQCPFSGACFKINTFQPIKRELVTWIAFVSFQSLLLPMISTFLIRGVYQVLDWLATHLDLGCALKENSFTIWRNHGIWRKGQLLLAVVQVDL